MESSVNFIGGPSDGSLEELRTTFKEAVEHAATTKVDLTEDVQRKLFGLFHRGNGNSPAWLMQRATARGEVSEEDMERVRAQMTEVESVAHLPPTDAMRQYIDLLTEHDSSFLFENSDDEGDAMDPEQLPPDILTQLKAQGMVPSTPSMAGASSSSAPPPAIDPSNVFEAAREGLIVALTPSLPSMANKIDEDGLSVLHHAVDAEKLETAVALLAARANPNARDPTQSTPLHFAALLGSAQVVSALLVAGADTSAHDEDGKSPADLARDEGHAAALIAALEAPTTPPPAAAPTSAAGSHPIPITIPIIDVGAFASGTPDERAAIARAFDEAFCTVGVCHVTNYDALLPPAVIDDLRGASMSFFGGTTDEKKSAYVDGVVGYLGEGAENVGASAGAPTALPDPVESLNLPGYQEEGQAWSAKKAAAECPWRHAPWLPQADGFGTKAVAYWGGATRLMTLLMEMAELALELPTGFFTADQGSFAHPGTLLRVAHYSALSGADAPPAGAAGAAADGLHLTGSNRLRYGAHTDYDGFTILQRAPTPPGHHDGLEFEGRDGTWLPVPSPPNTLTVNIGDLLARWTNDRWRATRHRVAGGDRAARERLSVVYFTGPHPDTLIECVPSQKCMPKGTAPKYAPVTAAAHVEAKMHAATKDAADFLQAMRLGGVPEVL